MKFNDYIRDFVFGMEDGLVSNLGLVLGVYFGSGDSFAVVLAGLASMFAGAFSMSAGSYLSAKAQREVYENEIEETKKKLAENPKECLTEMKKILKEQGLNKLAINTLIPETSKSKHPQFFCNYLVHKKVGISKRKLESPHGNALTMFLSFFFGSLFPVLPFIIFTASNAVMTAIILTVVILFSVGVTKTIYTKRSWLKSGIEMVVVGVGAGILGYFIGWLIGLM
jgi:vacuolar iron transporter family protein